MRRLEAGNNMNRKILHIAILESRETSCTATKVEDRTGSSSFGLGRRNIIDSSLFNCGRVDCTSGADFAFQGVHRDQRVED